MWQRPKLWRQWSAALQLCAAPFTQLDLQLCVKWVFISHSTPRDGSSPGLRFGSTHPAPPECHELAQQGSACRASLQDEDRLKNPKNKTTAPLFQACAGWSLCGSIPGSHTNALSLHPCSILWVLSVGNAVMCPAAREGMVPPLNSLIN